MKADAVQRSRAVRTGCALWLAALALLAAETRAAERAVITTDYGLIEIELRPEAAPKTIANFKKLVAEKFYDGTTFHRVVPGLIIQGGDPHSKDDNRDNDGSGGPGYTVPAEIKLYHVRGAVGCDRVGDAANPEKESNGSQFYIVLASVPVPEEKLAAFEAKKKIQYPPEIRSRYLNEGGSPFLDNEHTVFAHVVRGLDVAEKIAAVPRDDRDNPREKVTMRIEMATAQSPAPAEPATEPETPAQPAEPQPQPEPQPEPEPQAKPEAQPEPEPQPEAPPEPEPKPEAQPEPKPQPEAQPQPEAEAEAQPKAEDTNATPASPSADATQGE